MIFLSVGLGLLISELWKQYMLTYYVYGGAYCYSFIPFQLCSVAMYVSLVLGMVCLYAKENTLSQPLYMLRSVLLEFLSTFSLLGATLAFLDTSGMYYPLSVLTAHSFLWHFVLIGLGIYAGTRKRERGPAAFASAAGIYLMCCVIAQGINVYFDRYDYVNMFYINPHYRMGQIVFERLTEFVPNILVIGLYIGMTIAGAAVLHVMWKSVRDTLFY